MKKLSEWHNVDDGKMNEWANKRGVQKRSYYEEEKKRGLVVKVVIKGCFIIGR